MYRVCLLFLFLIFLSHDIRASDAKSIKSALDVPLKIDSRDGLKCDRVKQVCSAKGKVVVRKGEYEMFAEEALAYMRKTAEGKTEIKRLEAYKNVKFFGLKGEAATCGEAFFDMDKQVIELIPRKNKQVHVWKDNYVLLADILKIHLAPDEQNKLKVSHIDASGHVTLSSPEELIKGDFATYNPATSLIDVTGDVRLNRDEGQIRGSYAQVNIDTKLSKMLKRHGNESDKMVQVFVYPEKAKKSELVK